MTKLSWSRFLELQQKEFIERLKSYLSGNHPESPGSPVTLSRLVHDFDQQCECHYSELIKIYYPHEVFAEEIEDYSYQMADYYYDEEHEKYEYEDYYANYKIGKLGEEAVKICLGNLISNVDYQIHEFGDGGSDFYLASNKNIKLQVKTKVRSRILQRKIYEMGEEFDWYQHQHDFWINSRDEIDKIDNISWSINEKEVNNNKILICVLMLDDVIGDKIEGRGYSLVMAGFKPTDMINDIKSIKMKDLFYSGGIRGYLEFLC